MAINRVEEKGCRRGYKDITSAIRQQVAEGNSMYTTTGSSCPISPFGNYIEDPLRESYS